MFARVTCIPPSVAGAQEQPQAHWRAGRYWQKGPQYVELTEKEAVELKKYPANFVVDEVSKSEFEKKVVAPPETPEQKNARLEGELQDLRARLDKLAPKEDDEPTPRRPAHKDK